MKEKATAALVKSFASAYFTTVIIILGLNSSDLYFG